MFNKFYGVFVLGLIVSCNSSEKGTSNGEVQEKEYNMIEYSELEKLNIRLPYKYQYSNNDKAILVYGSYHTSNPQDSIIADIESTLEAFKPDLVLYEGDGISFEETKAKSIEYYFEMGLVRHLSHQKNIPDANIEPPTKDKYAFLLKKYNADEVFLATIGLQFTLLLVSNSEVDFVEFYKQFARDIENEGFPVSDSLKNVDYFYKIYTSFYKKPFDLKTFDYETVEIKFNKTKLNLINQEAAHFRDLFMLNIIEQKMSEYKRIYVQIGGRHAIVWEPAVKELIQKGQ